MIRFGLQNDSSTFQQPMDVILFFVKWQQAVIYLDNVVTFSKTPAKHIEQGQSILTRSQDAGLASKLKKREFFTGCMVSRDTLLVQHA